MLSSLEVLIKFLIFTLLHWNWVIRNINPCIVPVFSPLCVARLAGECTLHSDSIIIVPKCFYIWVVTSWSKLPLVTEVPLDRILTESLGEYILHAFIQLVASTTECAVIYNPSWVCQDINIRLRALLENSPGRLAMLSFQSLRYPRKSFSNQANLWSFTDVYGARNGFLFLWYSVVLRTLRQSKNESIISHNFAVAVASGE